MYEWVLLHKPGGQAEEVILQELFHVGLHAPKYSTKFQIF
jgi:hypothetical protein